MSTIEAGRTGRKMDSDRQTMTVEEAARKLGISRNSAYEAARQGQIPTIRIGRLLLVPKVAFDRLLEQAGQ